jgi:hypothetical protein
VTIGMGNLSKKGVDRGLAEEFIFLTVQGESRSAHCTHRAWAVCCGMDSTWSVSGAFGGEFCILAELVDHQLHVLHLFLQ